MDAIKKKRPFINAWFALSELVEIYEKEKAASCEQKILNERADIIAAFRTVESRLGIEQTIPRRVR